MLLTLDDDQEVLRDTTARFLSAHAQADTLRGLRHDPAGFDDGYWVEGTSLGWTSLLVHEAHGGGSVSGEGLVDLSLLAHEFGMRAAPGPLVTVNVVAGALSAAGAHLDVVERLLTGAEIATWAFAEPPPHDGLHPRSCTIRRDGDAIVVAGSKQPVESAARASYLLVSGSTPEGPMQVLVPTDAPGVRIEPMRTVDLTRRFSVVTFDDVRLPSTAVVGDPATAGDAIARQLAQTLVLTAAESVGAMQRSFDLTLEWAFDRFTFGRALASYQAIKHRMADMKSWLEAAHAVTDAAVESVQHERANAGEVASSAKAFVGEYGTELAQESVQLFGGVGLTFEHDLHLFLRRLTLDRALWGTPADHHLDLADLLDRSEAADEALATSGSAS